MGTKVHCKSYLPGYYSMRDLNEDCSSSNWPLFYGEKPVTNGQYYNGFTPGPLINGSSGHDEKDALKQKMLEHEAVFKNQVCELHRLYKIQRDMMEEAKRKEHHKHRASLEPSTSSSLHGSQMPLEDARKWHMAGFPLLNSSPAKTGIEIVKSPMSCTKAYNNTNGVHFPFHNGSTSKGIEITESRPSKVRKKLFDLQLPADEYLDIEDEEKLRGDIGLTDLNEPVQVEEAMAPSSVDFLGKGKNPTVGSNAGFLGVTRETNGFCLNSSIERKLNEKGRLSRVYEEGSSKNIPSHPVQAMLNQVHHSNGIYPTVYNHSRDGPHHGLESSDRNRDPFFSSWAKKPESSFAQKLTTYGSSSTSTSTILPFGGKWQANGGTSSSSRLFRSDLTLVNGFNHASTSRSKELHVPGFDYPNCSRGENVLSDRTTNNGVLENSQTGPCRGGSRPIDINLNEVVSNEMQDLNEAFPDQFCSEIEKVVMLTSSDSEILRKNEISNVQKILGVPIVIQENEPSTSKKLDCHFEGKKVDNERKKRVIDINLACEPDEDEELNLEIEKREKGVFVREQIDLNTCFSECEEPQRSSCESESGNVKKVAFDIDLEVSVFPENEDDNTPPDEPMPKNDEILRNAAEIMVSMSSFCPQSHEDDSICQLEACLAKSLLLVADACEKELESPSRPNGPNKDFADELDEFEAKTLQLEETKEEDYMPKPFVPEFLRVEDEVGPSNASNTRPRRGQARRGRQRRDFQKDILPGLTSLSRHEVTEDIQTFTGIMRATGHSWASGSTRRNGSRKGAGRGRRRAVVETGPVINPSPVCAPLSQQNASIEAGLEDRSLTGWGRTTRRPRRQRCHAGNNTATIVLT